MLKGVCSQTYAMCVTPLGEGEALVALGVVSRPLPNLWHITMSMMHFRRSDVRFVRFVFCSIVNRKLRCSRWSNNKKSDEITHRPTKMHHTLIPSYSGM